MTAKGERRYIAAGNLLREIREDKAPPPRSRVYSQDWVAFSDLKIGPSTYRNYEQGVYPIPGPLIEIFYQSMGATLQQRSQLYQLTGQTPIRRPCSIEALGNPPGLDRVYRKLKRYINKHAQPAYVCSGAWEVVPGLVNDPYRMVAESIRRTEGHELDHPAENPMRFGLGLHPDAPSTFTDWAGQWQPAFMAFLKGAYEANPDDPVLKRTHDDVMRRPDLAAVYEGVEGNLEPMAHHHVDKFVSVELDGWQAQGVDVWMHQVPELYTEWFQILVADPFEVPEPFDLFG